MKIAFLFSLIMIQAYQLHSCDCVDAGGCSNSAYQQGYDCAEMSELPDGRCACKEANGEVYFFEKTQACVARFSTWQSD